MGKGHRKAVQLILLNKIIRAVEDADGAFAAVYVAEDAGGSHDLAAIVGEGVDANEL